MSSKTVGQKRSRAITPDKTIVVPTAVVAETPVAEPAPTKTSRKKSNAVPTTIAPAAVAPAAVAAVSVAAPAPKPKSRSKAAPKSEVVAASAPVVTAAPVAAAPAPVAEQPKAKSKSSKKTATTGSDAQPAPAAPTAAAPAVAAPSVAAPSAFASIESLAEEADQPATKSRRGRKQAPEFPSFLDWSLENAARMREYSKYLAENWSEELQAQFVRRIIKEIVSEGDSRNRPVSNFDQSLLKYKQRLETGQYVDSKGNKHSFPLSELQSLNGKWLSHYKVTGKFTYDWIKQNVRNPSIYADIPAEILMLMQVLHSKGIRIKGVVSHGMVTETVGTETVTKRKADLGEEESLRVYVGPTVPFDKCHVVGPEYAFDPRKDGVKVRAKDYKSGVQRYLSIVPLVSEMKKARIEAKNARSESKNE